MKQQLNKILTLIILFFVGIPLACAEHLPIWEVHAGLASLRVPHYRGSASYNNLILPFPVVVYRGERLKIDDGRVRGLLFTSELVNLDISLAGSLPASPDDNSAREGMPQLDPTIEVGPSLNALIWQSKNQNTRLSVEFPVRLALSVNTSNFNLKDRGLTFAPVVSIKHNYADWKGELAFGSSYASRRYHNYFYTVADEYATATRSVYQATKGNSGSHITLSMSKHFEKLSVIGFARFDWLSKATFIDSPLIERNNNLNIGFIVTWRVAESKYSSKHPN